MPPTTHTGRVAPRIVAASAVLVALLASAAQPAAAQATVGLRIDTAAAGGATLGAVTLAAGDTLRLYAAGIDSVGGYAGPVSVTWAAIPALATLTPTAGTTALLSAETPGTFRVQIADLAAHVATSGDLQIVPGAPVGITVHADSRALAQLDVSADSTLVLYAHGVDAFSNDTGPISVQWTLDAPLAVVQPASAALTVLDARVAGTTTLRLASPGLVQAAIPLQVRPGRLAQLRIATSPAGPALGDTTVVAGSSFLLHAVGSDADGNLLALPPTVTWSSTAGHVLLTPALGSSTLLTALDAGNTRVRASAGAIEATTGTVSIVTGPLARVRISTAPDAWIASTADTADADAVLELFALGEDAFGQKLGPVAVDWGSTDPLVLQPRSLLGSSVLIDAKRIGTARIWAQAVGAAADTSATLTVVPGNTARIRIESMADGSGIEIGAATLSSDSLLELHAVGRDADGNFTALRPAEWTLSAPIGSLSAGTGTSIVFDPQHTGTGRITAIDFLFTDATGTLTVTAGRPSRLRVEDAGGTEIGDRALAAGDSLDTRAGLQDADGNPLGTAAASWSWAGDSLAALPPAPASSFGWRALRGGRSRLVIASAGVLPDSSGWITVGTGGLSRIDIRDIAGKTIKGRLLAADSTLVLRALAFDAADHLLGDVPVDWELATPGGGATLSPLTGSSTVLHPATPIGLAIRARHASGLVVVSDTLFVVPGAPASVSIESTPDGKGAPIGTRTLTAGGRLDLYAIGRDAHGNFTGPLDVAWVVQGGIGTLETSFGPATAFIAASAGTGSISALHATLPATQTGSIQVQAGAVAALTIEHTPVNPSDPPVDATLASGDSLQVFAVGRDAYGNAVANPAALWELIGDPSIVVLSTPGAAGSTWLRARRVGAVQLRATWNGFAATMDTLRILPGSPARVVIETAPDGTGLPVLDRDLVAGESLVLHAVARDANDNLIGSRSVSWSVEGGLGTLSTTLGTTSTLLATRAGTGRVAATDAALGVVRTGSLRVAPGPPAVLLIERTPVDPADPVAVGTLTSGDSLDLYAVARDVYGNRIDLAGALWSVVGDPTVALVSTAGPAASTRLRARLVGSVRAHADWQGLGAETGPITVVAGSLSRVQLESAANGLGVPIGARSLSAGSSLPVYAIGRDPAGNFIAPVDVSWELVGGIGRLEGSSGISTRLWADRPGTGFVRALHSILAAARTGDVTVTSGTPASLVIERTLELPLDPLQPLALAAGDSLLAFAVLRDSLGNVVGPANASWSLVEDPTAAALRASSSPGGIWFHGRRVASSTLRATWNGLAAQGGPIDVVPGAPTGAIPIAATPDSARADGAALVQLAIGPILDAYGNPVAEGTGVTVFATAGTLLEDLDPAIPGAQRTVHYGAVNATLRAPSTAATVRIDATSGAATGSADVAFLAAVVLAPVAGSWSPADVLRGGSLAPRIQVRNDDVGSISIATGTVWFEDANGIRFESALAQSVNVPPGGTSDLGFASQTVPMEMQSGSAAPRLTLQGSDVRGQGFAVELVLPPSTIRVRAGAAVHATDRIPARLTAGTTVQFEVVVVNAGDGEARLEPESCTLTCAASGFSTALDPSSDQLLEAGAATRLRFRPAQWPAGPTGDLALVMHLQGTQPGGAYTQTLAVDSVRVEAPARIADLPQTLQPQLVPQGGRPELAFDAHNIGGSAVQLGTSSRVLVAGRAAALTGTRVVAADSIATLAFGDLDLDGLAPGRYAVQFEARGTQNATPFSQDLVLADSLVLFAPAALTIVSVEPSQSSVTRGQTQPWDIDVVLLNAGESTYRIDAATIHVILGGIDRSDTYTLVRRKSEVIALAPAARDTVRFRVDHTGDDTGSATLEAGVQATDLATGESLEADTFAGGKGSVQVQLPGSPTPAPLEFSQPSVSSGQTRAVEALLTIRNAGEASIDLAAGELASRVSTLPNVPVTVEIAQGSPHLVAGDTLVLRYLLGPFAVPPGTLVLDCTPRFTEGNRGIDLPVAIQDSLVVHVPAAVSVLDGQAPDQVTAGRALPWTVAWTVRNTGESAARLIAPALDLRDPGADVTAAFQVVAPDAFEGAADLVLPGGGTQRLLFQVTSTDSLPRDLSIALTSGCVEIESGRAFTIQPGVPIVVRVQGEPVIVLADSTLAPRAASRGQVVQLSVEARNDGEATLELDPSGCRLKIGDADVATGLVDSTALDAGATAVLRFEPVEIGVASGQHTVQFHFEGRENGNPWSTDLQSGLPFDVETATSLEILSVRASRALVTQGQTRPWAVRVAVRNHGAAANLESTTLHWTLAAEEVTSQFAVHSPAAFVSGNSILATGAVDTLQFDVNATANIEGVVVLDAELTARDTNSGDLRTTRSLGAARGSVKVARPARPVITAIVPSQTQVSAGQERDWQVRVTLENHGGTPWRLDPTATSLAIGTAGDDSVRTPTTFEAGDLLMEAAESATVLFVVTRTGSEIGDLALAPGLAGVQDTDGTPVQPLAGPAMIIRSQIPALARLVGIIPLAPRAPYVNANRPLALELAVENLGEATIDSCVLRMQAPGCEPADTTFVIEAPGGEETRVGLALRTGSVGAVTIDAAIEAARDGNDPSRTNAWIEPHAAQLDLVVQEPGRLEIAAAPGQARVSAGQTSPWWVAVEVRNTGEEPLRLGAPQSSDLHFERGGAAQADYVIVAPDSLDAAALLVAGGGSTTLQYRVARTGTAGGTVDILARLQATHLNENDAPLIAAVAATSVTVDAEPGMRIVSTETITYRRQHGYDDFRVDVGQPFTLRIVVENTGGTWLDSLTVGVDSQRGNSSIETPGSIVALGPGQRGALDLPAVAGSWLSQPGLPEIFNAYVLAARDRNSGLPVLPGAAVDNISFAYVESPARLDLATWIDAPEGARDGIVSTSQQLVLAARVDNQGTAAISTSGRLVVDLPEGFALEAGDRETFFAPGETVQWTLRAPSTSTASAETLAVRFASVPNDANTGDPATMLQTNVGVPIVVRDVGELQLDLAVDGPAGALDAVVSTGQWVDLVMQLRADPALEQREAELELPSGWSTPAGGLSKRELPADPEVQATWSVVAGSAVGSFPVVMRVTGRDRNAEIERTAADTLWIHVERAPRLALTAAIVAPEEARDGRVLPGQRFTVRAWVRNHGDAALVGASPGASGTLRLAALPVGYSTDASTHDYQVEADGTATTTWEIESPTTYRPDVETLRIDFDVLPLDANSGAPAALVPDSSSARFVVALSADAVRIETQPLAVAPAVPGTRRVPMLGIDIVNQAEATARIDSVGIVQSLSGALASTPILAAACLVREDAPGDTVVVESIGAPIAWIAFPQAAGELARLAPHTTTHYVLLVDLRPDAPAGALELALRSNASGAPLLRVVEAGSGTPLPVNAEPHAPLGSNPARIVAAGLQAFNAPNPFHVGRETTTIRYALQSSADVEIRIATLQGELVWEMRRHEEVFGPELRSIVWDGRNGIGSEVRNGVYVCHVQVGTQTTRFKIAVLR